MANIANLAVQLSGNTGRFSRSMKGASRSIMRVTSVVGIARRAFLGFGAAIAGVVAGGSFLFGLKSAAERIDRIAKTSDRLGIATDKLAGLEHGAELAGIETNKLSLGIQRMVRRVAEAAQGTGEAQAAIKELGLEATAMARMSPDQMFATIADKMAMIPNQADRIRLGFKLFDSEGVDLIRLMDRGSEGIAEFMQDAERLGLTFDRIDAKQVEMANDAITRMRASFRGVFNTLAIELAPFISATIDKFTELATAGDGLGVRVTDGVEMAVKAVTKLVDVGAKIAAVFKGLQGFVLSLMALAVDGIQRLGKLMGKGFLEGIKLVNKIPGIDKLFPGIDNFQEDLERAFGGKIERSNVVKEMLRDVQDLYDESQKLWDQDTAKRVEEFFNKLRENQRQAAADAVGIGDAFGGALDEGGSSEKRFAEAHVGHTDRLAIGVRQGGDVMSKQLETQQKSFLVLQQIANNTRVDGSNSPVVIN